MAGAKKGKPRGRKAPGTTAAKKRRKAPVRKPAAKKVVKLVKDEQVSSDAKKMDTRNVDDMDRDQLEAYALEVGLQKRNLTLTDDRLRQNIKAFIAEWFENLTADVENAA